MEDPDFLSVSRNRYIGRLHVLLQEVLCLWTDLFHQWTHHAWVSSRQLVQTLCQIHPVEDKK